MNFLNSKKHLIFPSLIVFVLIPMLFTGCAKESSGTDDNNQSIESTNSQIIQSNNLNNGGWLTSDSEKMYAFIGESGIYKMNFDGSEAEKISENTGSDLVYANNAVYFVSRVENTTHDGIYILNLDDLKTEVLMERPFNDQIKICGIQNKNLYFTMKGVQGAYRNNNLDMLAYYLYSLDIDTGEYIMVADMPVVENVFMLNDGFITTTYEEIDSNGEIPKYDYYICKLSLDGEVLNKMSSERPSTVRAANDTYLFYFGFYMPYIEADDQYFQALPYETEAFQNLAIVLIMNCIDDTIYYIGYTEIDEEPYYVKTNLMKVVFSEETAEALSFEDIQGWGNPNIAGDYVFIFGTTEVDIEDGSINYGSFNHLIRMNPDGSDMRKINFL